MVTLTAGAGGIALNAYAVLGQTGATVELTSAGGINEDAGATLTAATLQSSGGIGGAAADLNGTANAIGVLDGFAVSGQALSLSDTGALSIAGAVSASDVTIGGTAGSTPSGITLSGTGSIVAPLVTLTAGAGGIALNAGALLGQTGATVDLTSAGGINEVAGATLTAATLQSSGGISGAAADLNGTANAIAALGNFAVGTNALSLSDTGPLGITGAVSASEVTIGGTAGSTPSGITLSGTGSIVAPVVTLTAGAGGIALNGTSMLGQTGATVDLTSAGGINEVAGATLTAATLQSSGGISGAAADLNGTANAIAALGNFAVGTNGLSLSDTGPLSITAAVSASDVTIGGAAGSSPTGITLSGTGSIVAPLVTLTAGVGGIALNAGALLGQTGATVDLTSAGGINEVAGATLTAATLQSSGGISGGDGGPERDGERDCCAGQFCGGHRRVEPVGHRPAEHHRGSIGQRRDDRRGRRQQSHGHHAERYRQRRGASGHVERRNWRDRAGRYLGAGSGRGNG